MRKTLVYLFLVFILSTTASARKTGCEGDCENGIGTWTYTDKTVYVGEWRGTLKNGQGTAVSYTHLTLPTTPYV